MPLSNNPNRPDYGDDRRVQTVDVVRPGFVWFLAVLFALGFVGWVIWYLTQ